ncbi:unnamed protein product [Psylliodes chrysocephalus]|uniref:Regulatory protein zeste n=1 Tax=Psylliodes chrysocephalus TaxID=3402493 RepID=A0A9P0CY47_9CUCU|nr:unnamed protein product [Psylliodes chrysocephala]
MNSEKRKTGSISQDQKKELIQFMEQNPDLGSGKFTKKFTFKTGQELWMQITQILNSLPGAKKDWRQWRKTWADIKVYTKKKNALIKNYRVTTGGGPTLPIDKILTTEDEKVVSMIGPLLIDGLDVEEPSAMFNFEQEPEENS